MKIIIVFILSFFVNGVSFCHERTIQNIGDGGWKLWLDREAEWKNDELYLPPVNVSAIKVTPPTCGWNKLFSDCRSVKNIKQTIENHLISYAVNVPGTVEMYCWDALSDKDGKGNSGDYVGVSWWGTDFKIDTPSKGKKIKLFFTEGIRQRAEVFINQKLVGYELVHQTPFEIDVTDFVRYGEINQLAVRITDPGGNFSWGDFEGLEWGEYLFPLSHGFGGILGKVQLITVSPLHVTDVFVKNKPQLTDIDVELELKNEGTNIESFSVDISIEEAWQNNAKVRNPKTLYTTSLNKKTVGAGKSTTLEFGISVPEAKLWEIRNANLYNLIVEVKNSKDDVVDRYKQRFGFRFLSVEGYNSKNPYFYFNGRRTNLISSISWGFWPVNGIFPTPELARKHIESAFALGQNMLNFHRCQGNTLLLNLADEMGMLYYEEPGGYSSSRFKPGGKLEKKKNKELAQNLNSQRFLRMVKRDRNHPSLVYYNMVNEPGWSPNEEAKRDMMEAHKLDPTRFKSYGSGFMTPGKDQSVKLHMLPYDSIQRTIGYCDVHNAGNSPGVYTDELYNSPLDFTRNDSVPHEIFVWGEEGAIASPPQLELINQKIGQNDGINGWDGADYIDWLQSYKDYISSKGLTKYYPSVTELISSMADVMYYEHGRVLENSRIADAAEIYVYNGYEDMKNDNFSGSVDVYRNIKGNPELMSYYAKPLYIAVKVRNKIGHVGESNLFDMFVINEHAIPSGEYNVKAWVINPKGNRKDLYDDIVFIRGGDNFSDFVTQKIPVQLDAGIGYYKIQAGMYDVNGNKIAEGHDEIFSVDWKSVKINGKGAIIGEASQILDFLDKNKPATNIVKYKDELGGLDYILATNFENDFEPISSSNYRTQATYMETIGIRMDYFRGTNFENQVDHRISTATIDFNSTNKLIPGYDILDNSKFSLRWDGYIIAKETGVTEFELSIDDGARVWFDGKMVIDEWKTGGERQFSFKKDLVKGQVYHIKMEVFQDEGGWLCSLKWKLPRREKGYNMAFLLDRIKNGTKLILIDNAEKWMEVLMNEGVVSEFQVFHPSKSWVGSSFFVREHRLFKDLPVNGAMNWEYQRLIVYNGPKHFGLYDMSGEEPVVSLVGSPFHKISTSVGVFSYGKGKIVFSSLDLIPNLLLEKKAAHVPKKILCNYLEWASSKE
ncbi:MAG: PA14 domain-containing protein [Mangrovibacterium sp.]